MHQHDPGPRLAAHPMLFAERVIPSPDGRYSLIGIFDTIDLGDFKQASTPWYIYMSIIGMSRKTKVRLLISRVGNDEEVYEGNGSIEINGPIPHAVECAFPIQRFEQSPGEFLLRLYVGDREIAKRTLTVTRKGDDANDDD